jgi:hypothetical protein
MQLLSVGLARSIWLFDINELNPTGKSIFPDAFVWLGEKYSFQTFPKSITEVDQEKKGYLFNAGQFQTDEDTITINFSIYNDGLVAETWASTEKGDILIEEILRSAARKYGLTFRPEMIRTKEYVSEVTVRLDHPLSNVNPRIARFCQMMTEAFSRHNLPPFELTGMVFGPDTSATSYKPPGFGVERKTGVPFSDNRFWSRSPFTTSEHIKVLEEFEQMLVRP